MNKHISKYTGNEIDSLLDKANIINEYSIKIDKYGYAVSVNRFDEMLELSYAQTKDWTSYYNNENNLDVYIIPNILGSKRISFKGYKNLNFIPKIDCSKVENLFYAFCDCLSLEKIELVNLDLGSDTLNNIPYVNMLSVFQNCTALKTVTGLNGVPTKSLLRMWNGCPKVDIPYVDTHLVSDLAWYWPNAGTQTTFPEIDLSSVPDTNTTVWAENWSKLNVSNMTFAGHIACNLQMPGDNYTRETMMNVIRILDDYSGGKTHKLVFGPVSLARLSADDIKIATDKNWTLA